MNAAVKDYKKAPPNGAVTNIGPRIRQNFSFLYALYNNPSAKERWFMIQNATREQLLSIVDICSNLRYANFTFSAKEKKKLERYKNYIQRIKRSKSENSVKKIIQEGEGVIYNPNARLKRNKLRVVQRGGLLSAVLVPVLTALALEVGDRVINRIRSS